MKTKFGLLGGAGSICTQEIYSEILSFFAKKGATKDNQYPYLLVSNYPFSCLNQFGISDLENFNNEIKTSLNDLSNCDRIFILCNSFHYNLERYLNPELLQKIINLPVLAQSKIKKDFKYILLASRFSYENNIFCGEQVFHPHENIKKEIDLIISQKISNKKYSTLNLFEKLKSELDINQFNGIIIGCTELYNLDYSVISKSFDVINPLNSICEIIYQES